MPAALFFQGEAMYMLSVLSVQRTAGDARKCGQKRTALASMPEQYEVGFAGHRAGVIRKWPSDTGAHRRDSLSVVDMRLLLALGTRRPAEVRNGS